MGRLAGSEARQLQASLQQVASILAKDTATAFSERKEQSGVQRVSAPVPAPVQASAAPPAMKVWPPAPAPALALAPAPAPLTLTRPPSPAVAPVSVPVPLAPPAAVQAEAEAETVPIAKGLDDFLRSPKSLSVEVYNASSYFVRVLYHLCLKVSSLHFVLCFLSMPVTGIIGIARWSHSVPVPHTGRAQ